MKIVDNFGRELNLLDEFGTKIKIEEVPELVAAARQAFGALVGSTPPVESVQHKAKERLKKALIETVGRA